MIRSHGVSVKVSATRHDALESIRETLKQRLPLAAADFCDADEIADIVFLYRWNKDGLDAIFKNGERMTVRRRRDDALMLLGSQVRLSVAEFAPDHVFLHAGAVAINGKALVIPGNSLSGKTTLTAELVRRGAIYYSDEYAVIDKECRLCPFPKDLSIRPVAGDYKQVEVSVELLGGKQGKDPLPIDTILITEYVPNSRWRPKLLTPGEGYLEMISHTVPLRHNPEMTLERLSHIVGTARLIKTKRGDAATTAKHMLTLLN